MSLHDEDYLFSNRLAPLTSTMCFLRESPENTAELGQQFFANWARGRWHVGIDRALGDLKTLIRGLAPLRRAATRFLCVPTRSDWTALFSNDRNGTEQSIPSLLASRLRCDLLRIVDSPGADEVRYAPVSMPARMFGFSSALGQTDSESRVVELLMEDEWEFEERGTPLRGEDTSAYRVRRSRDRFPHSQLRNLCSLVGASPFDVDFYALGSGGAIRLSREMPLLAGDPVTLEEAQAERSR